MEERTNAVVELMRGLVSQADTLQVYYQKKFWTFGEPDFPIKAGTRFVRDQLKALEEAEKDAQSN